MSGDKFYNVLFVDGADNCAYDLFVADDITFGTFFKNGADICFIEDVFEQIGERRTAEILRRMSENPILKTKVNGIHGIVFFGLLFKKEFYPLLRDSDLDGIGRSSVVSERLQQQRE